MLVKQYIIQKILRSVTTITLVVCVAISIVDSLRLLELLVNRSITSSQFFLMVAFLFPRYVSLVLPFSLFAGTVHVFYTAVKSKELTAMKSVGVSNTSILLLALKVGAGVFILATALHTTIVPMGLNAFEAMKFDAKNTFITSKIPEAKFMTIGDNTTLFVRKIRGFELNNILVYQKTAPDTLILLTAQKGIIITGQTQTKVILYNGVQQLGRGERTQILTFKQYVFAVKLPIPTYKTEKEPAEMTSLELATKILNTTATAEQQNEFYARFLYASINILVTLIAGFCVLVAPERRFKGWHVVAVGSASGFLVVALLDILLRLSPEMTPLLWLVLAILAVGCVTILAITLYMDRKVQ